jgi:uncharacterized repeat protein (TIGR01451 family)
MIAFNRTALASMMLFALFARGAEHAQAPLPATSADLRVHAIAEVESRSRDDGHIKLVAADRVVPGDRMLYTLEVHNAGVQAVDAPVVIQAVPDHTRYVDDSAVGPGADVSFSVDGGHHFDRPQGLTMPLAGGSTRPAAGADYTHIRWHLKNPLAANSTAFVRFRVVVK